MKPKHKILVAFLLVVCILFGSCQNGKQPSESTSNKATTTEQAPVEPPAETTPHLTDQTTPEVATPEVTTPDVTTPEETTPEATTPEETTPEETTPEATTPADPEDTAYLDISIRKPRGYLSKKYARKDSAYHFTFKGYLEWEHREDGDGSYQILRDGIEIGRIVAGDAEDLSDWKILSQKEAAPALLQVTEYLERYGTGETLRFRHRFCYRYMECGEERIVTITFNYGEIDTYVQNQLRSNVAFSEYRTDPMYGALSHLQDKPILVLGNSFIPYSNIVYIYNDIAKNSGKLQVMTGQSRGYVGTYAGDTELMRRVANGEWGAVLVCGFYNVVTNELGVIKAACQKSGTELIIFPAHNESDSMIERAKNAYPDLRCINWKREIDLLIGEGRSKWDFCINDGHTHSTPLAGYVAAMMIWRAIWGEMPTDVKLTFGAVDQANATAILGEYMDSPTFALVDTADILFLE